MSFNPMIILKYILFAFLSIVMTLVAYCFSWFFALFIDKDGNLPHSLRWFQPSDNLAIGDAMWKIEHPGWSNYQLARSYMMRNLAQGFDQFLAADVTDKTHGRVWGNPDIRDAHKGVAGWYFITANGYFHLAWIIPIGFDKCLTSGFGWRLHTLAKGYSHKTLGQLVFTPFRVYKFSR